MSALANQDRQLRVALLDRLVEFGYEVSGEREEEGLGSVNKDDCDFRLIAGGKPIQKHQAYLKFSLCDDTLQTNIRNSFNCGENLRV